MAGDLQHVDPQWAWQPLAAARWNRSLAAHLYRRAGFAANGKELNEAEKLGPQATLDRLFDTTASADFDRQTAQLADTILATNNPHRLSAWWLYRMIGTPAQAIEKLTLFWHGHFATSAAKVEDAEMMLAQYRLLREHAQGRFEPLVQAISKDPAMLYWLDSTTNRKTHPNENYAREVMELFCLGVGNYTEKDIQEVARAFTGWELRQGKFRFNPYQHDRGSKSFLGASGNFNGEDAVRIIVSQPAAPRFIARKLFRFYVCDEPTAPDSLIEPLAAQLTDNGFEIGPVVRSMISSNLFYSEHAVARKVRSPVELGVGLMRALSASTNVYRLSEGLQELGQSVFYPPNVKGWDGGRTWINSSTLLTRANLVRSLLNANETRFAGGAGLAALARQAGVESPAARVDWLAELLLPAPLADAVRQPLVELAGQAAGDDNRAIARLIQAISTLPEFQLT